MLRGLYRHKALSKLPEGAPAFDTEKYPFRLSLVCLCCTQPIYPMNEAIRFTNKMHTWYGRHYTKRFFVYLNHT